MNPTCHRIVLFLLVVLVYQNCTTDHFEQQSAALTEEESLIAGQIIGESVSENQYGLLSSFSEAFAIPTESRLITGPSVVSSASLGNPENYTHNFDPETGVHEVSFTKEETNQQFTTTSDLTLSYTFFDSDENTIASPDRRREEIESVDFKATRSGEIQAEAKISNFTRTDRLMIDGLTSDSGVLHIDGFHSGEGAFRQIRPDGSEIEREYLLDMNFLDIRIDKQVVQANRSFKKGVNGSLSYETTIRENGSGTPETKIVNGTMELNGDGTAILKFREQIDSYRLRLDDGEVFDEDEFEGRVTEVNEDDNIFTLSSGQRIQINEETEIETEDFNSLENVWAAVEQGIRVFAEGDYHRPDESVNLWVATEVEFELESDEFEDQVVSADVTENSFTLLNGDRFFITESSETEFEDELNSLTDVAEAASKGMPVMAEGEFHIGPDSDRRIVKEVEFELEFEEFDEEVIAVDPEENTFTLTDGKTFVITEDTVIDEDGDFFTLQEVAEALNDEEEEVEAEGYYYYEKSSGSRIAITVEFSD